jgi:hypothetical protein
MTLLSLFEETLQVAPVSLHWCVQRHHRQWREQGVVSCGISTRADVYYDNNYHKTECVPLENAAGVDERRRDMVRIARGMHLTDRDLTFLPFREYTKCTPKTTRIVPTFVPRPLSGSTNGVTYELPWKTRCFGGSEYHKQQIRASLNYDK